MNKLLISKNKSKIYEKLNNFKATIDESNHQHWLTCCLIALIAVGATNMEATSCSFRTLKNVLGSGVPTGLPCKYDLLYLIETI